MSSLGNIFITGARRGLGWELCQVFSQGGYRIYASATTNPKAMQIQEQFERSKGNLISSLPLNFALPNQEFQEQLPNIADHSLVALIHNASPYDNASISSLDEKTHAQYVNFIGNTLSLLQYAQKKLDNDGRLILIGSTAGKPGHITKERPMYALYKATLAPMLEAYNVESAGRGCLVTLGTMRPEESDEAVSEKKVAEAIFHTISQKVLTPSLELTAANDPYA